MVEAEGGRADRDGDLPPHLAEVGRKQVSVLGDFLRQRRGELGLSITKLAALSGVSGGHLSDIETGKRVPQASLLQKLAPALQVPLDQLLRLAGVLAETSHPPVPPELIAELEQAQRSLQRVLDYLKETPAFRSSP